MRIGRITAAVVGASLLVWAAVIPAPAPPTAAAAASAGAEHGPPAPWRGLTLESVADLDRVLAAVSAHSVRPTVRVVFQRGRPPAAYREAIDRLAPHAELMGLLLDSTALRRTTTREVRRRARAYLRAFGHQVDVWEVGNELNGSWVGRPRRINAKARAAFAVVEREFAALDPVTAVTLNYWPSRDCYSRPWEATLAYARRLPRSLRHGVDVVLLSFYETACSPRARPTAADFATTLTALGQIFDRADLGIGEIGAQGPADGFAEPSLAERRAIAERYYGMHAQLRAAVGPRFIGGYFWWYYATDCVPLDRPDSLWPVIEAQLVGLGPPE